MNKELSQKPANELMVSAMSGDDVVRQVALVHDVMTKVMKKRHRQQDVSCVAVRQCIASLKPLGYLLHEVEHAQGVAETTVGRPRVDE